MYTPAKWYPILKCYAAQPKIYKNSPLHLHSNEEVKINVNNNINNLMKAFNFNLLNNKKNLIKNKSISNIEKLTLNLIKWSILFIVQSLIPLKRKQEYYNFLLLKILKDKKNKILYGKYNTLLNLPYAAQVNETDKIKQTFKIDNNLSTINTFIQNRIIPTKSISFQLNSTDHNLPLPLQEEKQDNLNYVTKTSQTHYTENVIPKNHKFQKV